ncbi:MAG: T9SS type A sorting domain-containing protein [Hymenobacteraceae bacterium]|nr:T9SS type A sorting domain-containing protein [Hymenobacteraceae bacterium]
MSVTFPITRSMMLWRFTAAGDTLWTRQWYRGEGETAHSLCILPDGGFALIGAIATGLANGAAVELSLTRTDSAGNLLWWRTYDNLLQNKGFTISVCPDGGFLLGGYSYDLSQTDSFVVKTDSLGNVEWQRSFGSPTQDDGGTTVLALRDGTYLAIADVGTRVVNSDQLRRHIVYHLDSAGRTLSARRYGPEGTANELYAAHELADGSVILAGQQSRPDGSRRPEALVLKLCPDGEEVWSRTYRLLDGPDSHNYLRDLRRTADGGFVAAGFLFAFPPDTGTTTTGWVFRLDSAGYVQAGGTPPPVRCRPVGLPAPAEGAPASGVAVWPNPASDGRFAVRASRPGARYVVADALGRVVAAGALAGGETPLDLRAQPAGVYVLRLSWPDGRAVRRRLVR